MGKNQVFGGKCTVLSMSYSPERLLWKTLQLSMFEGLEQYLDRYPKSGTMRNGVLYELQTSEPLIEDRGGSVSLTLPTTTAQQRQSPERRARAIERAEKGIPLGQRLKKNGKNVEGGRHFTILDTLIYHQIQQKMLPTPRASQDFKPIRPLAPSEKAGTHGKSLVAAIGDIILPTPTVSASKNNPDTPSIWNRNSSLNVEVAKLQGLNKTTGKGFQLNPPFVEEMMGFPIGWTDLEP